MRRRHKIIFFILIVVLFFWTLASFLVTTKGNQAIVSKLESYTKRKVSVNGVYLNPLISLEIDGLEISGLGKIERLYITPSIVGLLSGRIALNEIKIIRPEFVFEKIPAQQAEAAKTLAQAAESVVSAPSAGISVARSAKRQILHFVIKRIVIKDGNIDFRDRTVGQNGVKIALEDFNLNLDNLFFMPQSVITDFKLSSRIPWQIPAQYGEINLNGWINLYKKDIQATLEIKNIDGISLYPYYEKWVDLEGARIQQAKLQFKSDVMGHNNEIVANCRLELTDIVFRPKDDSEQEKKAFKIATAVLGIFRSLDQGKIGLNFTIRTKMDRPEFGFDNIRMAFEDKLALATGNSSGMKKVEELMTLPADLIKGTLNGTTEVTKTLIESIISAGKSLGSAVVDIFKKDNPQNKNN
jgi:hypothetical protein